MKLCGHVEDAASDEAGESELRCTRPEGHTIRKHGAFVWFATTWHPRPEKDTDDDL